MSYDPFGMFSVSGSALTVYRTWLDAISDNIANMHTAKRTSEQAWQPYAVVANSLDYGGARNGVGGGTYVAEIQRTGSVDGVMVQEPSNPLADERGYVRYPDESLPDQMTHMLLAQRGYQANLKVVENAREAYRSALALGRS